MTITVRDMFDLPEDHFTDPELTRYTSSHYEPVHAELLEMLRTEGIEFICIFYLLWLEECSKEYPPPPTRKEILLSRVRSVLSFLKEGVRTGFKSTQNKVGESTRTTALDPKTFVFIENELTSGIVTTSKKRWETVEDLLSWYSPNGLKTKGIYNMALSGFDEDLTEGLEHLIKAHKSSNH